MLYEVQGDILLSKAKVIAHGVAPNDPMNQGLALALHERFPSMHKDFHHWCHLSRPEPGEAWLWGGNDGVRVINLLTQEGGYGSGARPGKATLTHVNHALRALHKIIDNEKFSSLALPRLATGVGGLEWDDVQPLISNHLGSLDIPIYIYTVYHADVAASEPGQE